MDFRLPKTEKLVTLQASGLQVVTRNLSRKKDPFVRVHGVILVQLRVTGRESITTVATPRRVTVGEFRVLMLILGY